MCLAVPGRIVEILEGAEPELRRAKVEFGGIRKEISLAFTPDAVPGQYVLVHVGLALSVIDEGEARQIFEHLRQIEGLEDLEGGAP